MNTYDKAHDLARALKNSDEYRSFLVTIKAIEADAQAKKMVREFIVKQMELEYEMMSGKGEDKGKTHHLQKMYEMLVLNSIASDFIQAYMRFQRTMGDVYKIIGESVAEGMDFFAQE